MTKEIKQTASTWKHYFELAVYNISILVLGLSLVRAAYGNYKYTQRTLHGLEYRFSMACSLVIALIGLYALGKWLINKELEVR